MDNLIPITSYIGYINYIAAAIGMLAIVITLYIFFLGQKSLKNEMDFAKTKAETVTERNLSDIQNTSPADRQYLLLKEYHTQGLAQSKFSFWFSLIFASVGFMVIIMGILSIDRNAQFTLQGQPFFTLMAGTIIDAVSALIFVQSNKARQLMTDFFDKLRTDRKLEEAMKLTEQISDAGLQTRVRVLLALNFVDRKSSDEFLCSVLNIDNHSPMKNDIIDEDRAGTMHKQT